MATPREDAAALLQRLRNEAAAATDPEEIEEVTRRIAQTTQHLRTKLGVGLPSTPVDQAVEIDPYFRKRDHLEYVAQRVAQAVDDVEQGQNRMIAVSMPPRSGKSTLLNRYAPLWLLRRHPDWSIITASFDGTLTGEWAGEVRNLIEDHPDLGIRLAKDGGARSRWATVQGGGIYSASIRSPLTGRGAKVLIIDDPIKDYVDAHSAIMREALWNWWLSVAQTRLEPPYLVMVIMTRWHEDDIIGRLLNPENEGDPRDWEVISIPAIAGKGDVLGREVDEPLISPLLAETSEEAFARWVDVKRSVGSYVWSSMYLQSPAPAKGAIFDTGWWRYWTTDPGKATEDGRVVYLDPSNVPRGRWLDSWDMAFKDTDASDYVVGQRWVRVGEDRFLVHQTRQRMSFTKTLAVFKDWAKPTSKYGKNVRVRLVEEKANGAAIINTLSREITGIRPINPKDSKVARARNITPEVESGHVYLPHPTDPGNEWVTDLISELRNFPFDVHDDQVDALTQALNEFLDAGGGAITVPGRGKDSSRQIRRDLAGAANTSLRRGQGVRRP